MSQKRNVTKIEKNYRHRIDNENSHEMKRDTGLEKSFRYHSFMNYKPEQ